VLVIHRRAGKTVAALNHLLRDALTKPGTRYAYIAPYFNQAKQIAWDILKEYARKVEGVTFNESELRADFANGSRITLFGADNPDRLRGLSLWGVIFDEYSQQPSNIFSEIILPALADHQGYAIWIGTPKGKNAFWELYNFAQNPIDENGKILKDEWLALLLTVEETGIIPTEELETQKAIMDPDEFQQEWYCSFDAAVRGAYYADQINKARAENRITEVPYDSRFPVHTVWDLGVRDSTTIWFVQQMGLQIRVIDCYENSGEGLAFYKKVLDDRKYIYGTHYAPHDIQVKELGTGVSRLEVARTLGVQFKIVPNLQVIEGINAAREFFYKCWFDKVKCEKGINALSSYHKEWDEKRGEFKPVPFIS